ncbi:putative zn 2cys6 transcription factor protein [Eutypa lata UCREL1]|uniref:Putative zn 2cys6 transcription factor protein n=1 Tax=Eutypa lata (strain UCR-EL1) TaxID=1287681 RepID=M7SSH3_EUTLA|nr:putative zn 2cys6 transcription factor protein [Eutypa lata UCREL1]
MGRKPNYVILQHFDRGAKLQDNSNRYQFRCKSCGEDFPKGRIDSLTNHLTKKCPAISQTDRINACLALNGIKGNSVANRAQKQQQQQQQQQRNAALANSTATGPYSTSNGFLPATTAEASSSIFHNDIWAPLETLAEVSRQIEASEKHDDHGAPVQHHMSHVPTTQNMDMAIVGEAIAAAAAASAAATASSTDMTSSTPASAPIPAGTNPFDIHDQFTLYDRSEQRTEDATSSASVAQQHELSPEDRLRELLQSVDSNEDSPTSAASVAAAATARLHDTLLDPQLLSQEAVSEHVTPATTSSDMMIDYQEPERAPTPNPPVVSRPPQNTQHSISPWSSMTLIPDDIHGPVAVNDHGQHLFGALNKGGFLMSQRRVNAYKTSHRLSSNGILVEVSHFPDTGRKAVFQVLQGYPANVGQDGVQVIAPGPVILLDNDKEDVPAKVEVYMRQILNDLIKAEPSPYVRVTLETAVQVIDSTNDELLRRSLELWGMVEMMDRERGWTILAKSPRDDVEDYWIKDEADSEPYTNISMQLTAGAERKAAAASKSLLNGIQRNLQDGKIKLGFPMFLTVLLFLNCVEKTTWAFKAWEQENLRPKWPLEKPPSEYTTQGHGLCDLLRLLLGIRHILPKTTAADPNSPIITTDEDPVVRKYFQDLNITPAFLRVRHEENHFQPTDSRSLEFLFCAPLLIP